MSDNFAFDIEKIKKEKSGIDVLADIYFHAVFGEKINNEDLERFKWYGIYAQDEQQNFFKVKVPLSMGELNLKQIKTLSLISKKFSNETLVLSNEQKIELHNLKIFDLPEIFKLLQEVELSTHFEAGHTVRRVLTCPVNGIDETQLLDVEPIANKLNETFIGNKNFENLPNKLQIAISGYEEGCDVQFTPDVSFNATLDEKDRIVFAVKILDKNIGYITPAQVLNIAKAIANLYKDFGDRDDIRKSSFEYLINSLGIKRFFDILNSTVNYKIQQEIIKSENITPRKPRLGINRSKIEGESYIGCKLSSQIINSSNLDTLSSLLERFNASRVKLTHKSNIIILDVPNQNAKELAQELEKINFNPFV